jgi:exodeoxyribonuclease VII large subunit
MSSTASTSRASTDKPGPRSVSEVSQLIQGVLKSDPELTDINIIGEVSGHSQPASGHSYFSLRDREASLRCVMFRYGRGHQFLEDGALVICEGSAGVYAPRGDLQIIVTSAEPAGVGEQQTQLEELRRKLSAEGLFDPSRKRPIPQFPERIAVITSEQGAVWHDIANIARRRYPLLELLLVPSAVQGGAAPVDIIEAFAELHAYAETEHVDAVIVGRGGGSAEDLMPYNDEMLARTIFASRIPVISAVGHETDFTIADDVADLRAPTPSAAAELVSPDISGLAVETSDFVQRLMRALSGRVTLVRQRLDLTHDRLVENAPQTQTYRERVESMRERAGEAWERYTARQREAMKRVEAELRALSPLNILDRGYVIARSGDGRVVTRAKNVKSAEKLKLTFADGTVETETRSVNVAS